jgi:hypothetical protein
MMEIESEQLKSSRMKYFLLSLFFLVTLSGFSLEPGINKTDSTRKIEYITETFKGTRVILGQSVENPYKGYLTFLISHHFGSVNTGWYNFFGLDQASTRIGLEYGITRWLGVGVGRSTYEKTWDGYLKWRFLRQSKGDRKMPLSMGLFGHMAVNTLKQTDPNIPDNFVDRLSYCGELFIARKFGNLVSLQITPSWVHRNLVPKSEDHNDIFALGGAGGIRVSETISFNLEYYYLFPGQLHNGEVNSFSVSIDIRKGEHLFQIFFTNSQGNFEEAFITETDGKWTNGYFMLGFNIHRLFRLTKDKSY